VAGWKYARKSRQLRYRSRIRAMLWSICPRTTPWCPPARGSPVWFLPIGAGFGFLEGVMGSVGPLMAPFFLAFGLIKNAYIGTDALATVAMQGTKLSVFGGANLLTHPILAAGFTLVPFMILGTVLGKRALEHLPERIFLLLVEGVVVLAGLNFLIRG